MWNPFAYTKIDFNIRDKHDANVNKRLEIALKALEEIGESPMPVTENEKRICKIATDAIVKIYRLMVEVTQD